MSTGYVNNIEAFTLADVLRRLGASRETPTDDINLAVGLELSVQIGDHISEGLRLLDIAYLVLP